MLDCSQAAVTQPVTSKFRSSAKKLSRPAYCFSTATGV
jgi:hypothetical protein